MNKLEVGMYVRVKTFTTSKIGKLEKIDNICITDNGLVDKSQIINSSYNIIDLIEVGDYVNGIYVTQEKINNFKYLAKEIVENNYGIKSIVTKEQFESMEYKVGDSNE